jgi:AcrR family transcriptional regulator
VTAEPADRGEVRDRLLAAATRLFAEQGFAGTSVQQVVEAAGVTKGAFYYYFTSKDDLLVEIYGRLLALQEERLQSFLDADADPEQRLHDAAVDVVRTSYEHLDAFIVFVRSVELLDPAHQRTVRAARRRYHDRFRRLVEEGQEAGVFRDDISPDVAVHAFFGAAHAIPTWFRPRGRVTLPQVAEQLTGLLLGGLRADTAEIASRTVLRP